MEQLHNGFLLHTPPGTFPLSTDTMVLSDFVRLPKCARVLDLGSGSGQLGLLLCARDAGCHITGYELTPASHEAACCNIRANALSGRMESICADVRCIPSAVPAGSYDVCVSNPPYFSGGPASTATPLARRDDTCTPAALFAAAGWALRYGGCFFLVHKPEKLAELISCAQAQKLEPKRLRLVRHSRDSEISLILMECKKGSKPGLIWEELCLFEPDGSPTQQYKQIYHL